MDPATLLASPAFGSFAQGLGSGLGSSAGPSTATGRGESSFDSSGWNVNFGSGTIESDRSQAGNFDQYMPYVLAAVGVVVIWRLTRKR